MPLSEAIRVWDKCRTNLQPAAARVTTAHTAAQGRPTCRCQFPNSSERLASASAPSVYAYDETFPERVTVSRPPDKSRCPLWKSSVPLRECPITLRPTITTITPVRGWMVAAKCISDPSAPEPIAPGGQVHLSDDCPQCRDYYGHHHLSDHGQEHGDHKDCFNPCGDCGFFGGADYLLLRPTFSENTAYFRRNTSIDGSGNVTVTDTVVHQDFDYTSAPRVFLGYRFCDCGGEIRFTYWNYDNTSSQTSGAATTDTIYAGQLEINTSIPGQRLFVNSNLNMNVYDIDYSKCVCYGGSKTCNTCDACPVWTLEILCRRAHCRCSPRRRQHPIAGRRRSVAGHISADFIGAGPTVGHRRSPVLPRWRLFAVRPRQHVVAVGRLQFEGNSIHSVGRAGTHRKSISTATSELFRLPKSNWAAPSNGASELPPRPVTCFRPGGIWAPLSKFQATCS